MTTNLKHIEEFVRLLTDHQEVMRSYIINLVPGCSEVRDILQEVNIVLWGKMAEFELGTNFGAWACTVAYNKVRDYRKKQRRHGGLLVFNDDLLNSLASEFEDREPDALEEKRTALRHCLAKLSDKDRVLLRARYSTPYGDMKQLSSDTGRSLGSLRVSLSRLRDSLRNCITKRIARSGGLQ